MAVSLRLLRRLPVKEELKNVVDFINRELVPFLTERFALIEPDSSGNIVGEPGDPGVPGIPGARGEPGIQGVPGIEGDRGEQGEMGARGLQGIPGERGFQGQAGAQGDQGDQGDVGTQGIPGAVGATGIRGTQGSDGEPGEPGEMGIPGAQGMAGASGAAGQRGSDGEPGEQGEMGPAGAPGPPGPPGLQGAPGIGQEGEKGEQGDQGVPGATGATGATGNTGPQGPQGDQGEQGDQGNMGPPGLGISDGDKGDITVVGLTWTIDPGVVSNTKLAAMAQGTVKGRAVDAGSGDPQDLTGAQQGQNIRFATEVNDTTSSGTVSDYAGILSTTTSIQFNPPTPLTLNSIVASPGQEVILRRGGASTQALTLVHEDAGSTALNRIQCVNNVNIVLNEPQGGVLLRYHDSRWRAHMLSVPSNYITSARIINNAVLNTKLAQMAQGTTKGRVNTGGTGDPTDLTGAQLAENLLFGTIVTDSTSSGTVTAYSFAAPSNVLAFSNVTVTIQGIVARADGTLLLIRHTGTGATTLQNENAGATSADRLDFGASVTTPDLVLTNGMQALFVYTQGKWRCYGTSPLVLNEDKGDITVTGVRGQTWTIDNGVITPAKLAVVASNIGATFSIGPIAMTATGAAADDVIAYNANAPFAFRILKTMPIITTGQLLGTVNARNATGGGGTQVSPTFGATLASDDPAITVDNGLTATIAAGGTLVVRRNNGNITGEVSFLCVKT